MWFDSHCHLHLCETGTAAEILARAEAAGVDRVLTVGIDPASNDRSVELARDPRVFAAVGIHPNSATEWNDSAAARLDELLRGDKVVAVGETGLDYYWDAVAPDVQERAFLGHIALAKEHDKALVIHTRESVDAALEVLESYGPPDRLVFHCWSGSLEQLDRATALGSYVSFAGNVSFKNAPDLRAAAEATPAGRVLVETDSPYLSPVPFRGKPNEPARVAVVGEAVAAARGEDPAALAAQTSANARRLFGLG